MDSFLNKKISNQRDAKTEPLKMDERRYFESHRKNEKVGKIRWISYQAIGGYDPSGFC